MAKKIKCCPNSGDCYTCPDPACGCQIQVVTDCQMQDDPSCPDCSFTCCCGTPMVKDDPNAKKKKP